MHDLTPAGERATKAENYRNIYKQLAELLKGESDGTANAANMVSLLYHSLPDVNWVGFYFLHGEELVLGPFQGKPACTRIPVGKGVCGSAAARGEALLVPDVSEFEGHIACDTAARSEVALPLFNWGKLLGVLDVDSPVLNRFDEDDTEGLESLASLFLAARTADDLPDLNQLARDAEN